MSHFNTKKCFFVPSYTINVKETEKLDKFIMLLEKSGAFDLIEKIEIHDLSNQGGRPTLNRYDLLSSILYCFAFYKGTLRDIEDQCQNNLKVMYLMSGEIPSHTSIGNFINKVIMPNRDKLLSLITKAIFDECSLEITDAFIDGSKFEADANKYKFVWKPTSYHIKLSDKIRVLLERYDLMRGVPNEGIIESKITANKLTLMVSRFKDTDLTLKENKNLKKDIELFVEYLSKSLEYEEKERICGPNRNSYYKTDHDATAMCLKEDFYSGLGSNMHAAYNTQIMVSSGLILDYLVTQSRSDINDFIPIIQKHYTYYGSYPKNICADAGYGSLKNYQFLKENGIGNYVKHQTWEGEVSGRNPRQYKYQNKTITCLNGNNGIPVEIPDRHPKYSNSVFYRIEGCSTCDFSAYCKRYMKVKDENYKIFEVVEDLQNYINQAEENLLSPKGIEMRVNRSAQVEGTFGVIKQDMTYSRHRRINLEKVKTEVMLVCLGYNIRKLFRYYAKKAKFRYWSAPEGLEAELKKKPSAKRLSKKALKTKEKSVNQKSKKYKYKN